MAKKYKLTQDGPEVQALLNKIDELNTNNIEETANKSQSVETDKDSTAKYPSTKAVADAIEAGKQVFWAEYGVTTAAEIGQAVADGKLVACLADYTGSNGHLFVLSQTNNSLFWELGCTEQSVSYYLRCNKTTNVWTQGRTFLESISDKSQSVETDKTSTTKYPSTKAVWDELKVRPVMDATSQETVPSLNLENTANKSQDVQTDRESIVKYPSVKAVFDSLGKWGIVSQTQTWTGSISTGYDYTMSDLVWGMIPQANIDLYTAAGAVFNENTGYFELNGLTDISYNEMKEIYFSSFGKDREPQLENVLAGKACRTNYTFYSSTSTGYGSFGTTATRIGAVCKSSSIEIFNYENSGGDNTAVSKNKMLAASGGVSQAFAYAQKLHTIIGVMVVRDCTSLWYTFEQCYNLVNVKLRGVKVAVSFSHSSRLSLDSVIFLVDNADNTAAITITLHATAYARCQADTTEYTYNSQTYTGIIALATAKNITIASA